MRVGIIWDKVDSTLQATVLRDLLTWAEDLDPGEEFCIQVGVKKEPEWIEHQLVTVNATRCVDAKIWMAYIYDEEPLIPNDIIENVYRRQMRSDVRQFKLTPNRPHYPSLERPGDTRLAPPNLTIDLNRLPPRRDGSGQQLPADFWRNGNPFI